MEKTLSQFPLTWNQINGKGILTISLGNKKHEHLMNMFLIRRIFSNKITRVIWAKNLKYLLNNN